MTWTLCTSGAAINKAGAYANSTIVTSGTALAGFCDEAESIICDIARVDVVTNYALLTTNGKAILGNLCSAIVAQSIICYDPDAIGRGTATLVMNKLENDISRAKSMIEEQKIKTYMAVI
jgi:hypothetical protein